MRNKLNFLFVAILVLFLISFVSAQIPFFDNSKDKTSVQENSFFIDDWNLEPYYIYTDSAFVKSFVEIKHEFEGVFSADISKRQLKNIESLGIKTEPVPIYYLIDVYSVSCRNDRDCSQGEYCDKTSAVRGWGTCTPINGGGDDPIEPEPIGRKCFPSDQTPWGIERIYNNPEITSTSGGDGIKVAVLDTGVAQNHLDLKDNIANCVSFVTRFRPDVGNCEDGQGHGTHVAGTILANAGSDKKGIYGVAPEAKLIAVKVCDKRGYCYGDDIARGIDYSISNGANIISMSLGSSSIDTQIKNAIDRAVAAEILVIAAAGNSGPNLDTINYPAAYQNVISVAAIDSENRVADFSSRGVSSNEFKEDDRYLEISAPGVSVLSTYNDGCYAIASGTSMATPHIVGVVAKLWADDSYKEYSPKFIRDLLRNIAEDIVLGHYANIGYDPASGFGIPVLN